MTDEHPENNRVLHELLGRCWHEDISDTGFPRECSCGGSNCNIRNPDYADDPRLVLEGMRETVFFRKFLQAMGQRFMFVDYISVDLILDQTGRLRELAIEFWRRER